MSKVLVDKKELECLRSSLNDALTKLDKVIGERELKAPKLSKKEELEQHFLRTIK